MEKIRRDLKMIIYKYDQEKRGGIGRGLVDPELVDNLTEYVEQEIEKAREELFTKEESRVIRFAFRNMEEQINTVWGEDTYKELEEKLETILN